MELSLSNTTMVSAKVIPHRSKLSRLWREKTKYPESKSRRILNHCNVKHDFFLDFLTSRWSPLCRTPWGTNRLLPKNLLQVWTEDKLSLERFLLEELEFPHRPFVQPAAVEVLNRLKGLLRKLKIAQSDSAFYCLFIGFHSHLADCVCALPWKHATSHKSCLQGPWIAPSFSLLCLLFRDESTWIWLHRCLTATVTHQQVT